MGGEAVVLALLAALVHAGWNVVLAGVEDPQAAAPVALGVGALLLVPFGVAAWDVDLETSVLIAVALAAALGRERLSVGRAAGAVAVVAGVAALSLP